MDKILIIQTSPKHTASTFLVNSLYGFFDITKHSPVVCAWDKKAKQLLHELKTGNISVLILKEHNTSIDLLTKYNSSKEYKLYFVCSERPALKLFINNKYKNYPNVVTFTFAELNESGTNTVQNIVAFVNDNIKSKFNNSIFSSLNQESSVKRIKSCYCVNLK